MKISHYFLKLIKYIQEMKLKCLIVEKIHTVEKVDVIEIKDKEMCR